MTVIRLTLAAALVGLIVASCAVTRQGAWSQAQDAYNAGDYHKAIKKSDDLLSYGTPTEEDRANAALLKAKCYERLGQYAFVAKTFPHTAQGYQAAAHLARLAPNQPTKGEGTF